MDGLTRHKGPSVVILQATPKNNAMQEVGEKERMNSALISPRSKQQQTQALAGGSQA